MSIEHLIRMANQIGSFFAVESDPVVARAGVADHFVRFWEKRMRENIYACLDSGSCSGLSPLVSEALTEHRSRILGRNQ